MTFIIIAVVLFGLAAVAPMLLPRQSTKLRDSYQFGRLETHMALDVLSDSRGEVSLDHMRRFHAGEPIGVLRAEVDARSTEIAKSDAARENARQYLLATNPAEASRIEAEYLALIEGKRFATLKEATDARMV